MARVREPAAVYIVDKATNYALFYEKNTREVREHKLQNAEFPAQLATSAKREVPRASGRIAGLYDMGGNNVLKFKIAQRVKLRR